MDRDPIQPEHMHRSGIIQRSTFTDHSNDLISVALSRLPHILYHPAQSCRRRRGRKDLLQENLDFLRYKQVDPLAERLSIRPEAGFVSFSALSLYFNRFLIKLRSLVDWTWIPCRISIAARCSLQSLEFFGAEVIFKLD